MKKIITHFCLSLLMLTGVTMAQFGEPMVPDSRDVFGKGNGVLLDVQTDLQDYSVIDDFSKVNGNVDAQYGGAYAIRNIMTVIINFLEKMMVPIAIILLVWAAISLLINRGDEEQFSKRIRQIVWTGAGFLLFVFSFALVDYMIFGVQGQIFQGGNVSQFGAWARGEVLGMVRFVSSFAVALAVLFLVFGAVKLILLGENEEELSKVKKQVIFTILGILLIVTATGIASIFFAGDANDSISVNSVILISFIMYWANVILGFIALGAVIAIIWAGVQMILHFGNEEALNRSKKIILYAIIALVLAFSAFSIVRFFITPGSYGDNDQPAQNQLQEFDRGTVEQP